MYSPRVAALAFRPQGMPTPPHAPQAYPSLATLAGKGRGSRLSVCIVAPDLLGPIKNGGIGTACANLGFALADAGHNVHILFSQCGYAATPMDNWEQMYTARHISIAAAEEWAAARPSVPCFPDHPPLRMAKIVYDWLAEQPSFDLLLFMDWQGHGFYAMQAKVCGLRFQSTALITVTHSPSLWHCANNAHLPGHPFEAFTWQMERASLALADAVISPSGYMLDWCAAHGYPLPEKRYVQPNVLDQGDLKTPPTDAPIEELVFFGRLEYRKGLEQFCSALDKLHQGKNPPAKVTFLGKFAWMGNEHAALYIARRSARWEKTRLTFLPYYDQQQALAYLGAGGRLAVMPSVADNSPYTVYECLLAGIPFLARNVGGVAELIHREDQDRCLFTDSPTDLVNKMAAALGRAFTPAGLAFDPQQNRAAWQDGLAGLTRFLQQVQPNAPQPATSPRISVCLTHYMRPRLLEQAVDSLLAQDYPDFEVILADDGSADAASRSCLDKLEPVFAARGWQILRLANGYLGKARNAAAQAANGEYLLFMDDDNVAKPGMLAHFAQAATTSGADLAVSIFDVFSGTAAPTGQTTVKERYLPLGGGVACAVAANVIGDANSLMRKAMFTQLGGFSEDYGLGHEDFELFLRAVLHGAKTVVMPEAVFWYRRNGASMLTATNAAANALRGLRPFFDALPGPLGELAFVAHALMAPPATDDAAPALDMTLAPDAPEAVLAVTKALETAGQKPLARQLLQALDKAQKPGGRDGYGLQASAQAAARRGGQSKVRQCMRAFAAQHAAPRQQVGFYAAVLEALPKRANLAALRQEALDALRTADDGSVLAALMLAKHGGILWQKDQAAADFAQALERASAIYLRQRPDVAQAVKDGLFESALQHYELHGKKENVPWPEATQFKEMAKAPPLASMYYQKFCATIVSC